ncbi:unnamed protein product [Mytilus edulis]|uniref:C1q domain-containing protein n=1 Tax=Mytilus edulis TaxID=6550 RepID=A0A8S3RSJ1_MYTED|nr:unnamed protein product [Mytilus edulis]
MYSYDNVLIRQLYTPSKDHLNRKLKVLLSQFRAWRTRKHMDTKGYTCLHSIQEFCTQTALNIVIVKFDKLWTNNLNAYEVTTGVFTAPIPGLYHFTAVVMSESAKSLFLYLWHNDTTTAGSYTLGDGYKTGTFDVVFKLKKGDRVYIRCSSSCNGQKIYSSSNNYSTFSGYLISK